MTLLRSNLKLFFVLLIIFFELIYANCHATQLDVQFAGFAFRSDEAHVKKNYPYVYDISNEKTETGQGILDKALLDHVKDISFKDGRLVTDRLGTLGEVSLVMACCLDNEMVTTYEFEDGFKIIFDLGAQILLFDYNQMKLVESYPFSIELVDFSKIQPNDEMIRQRISALLLSNEYKLNLFDEFSKVLPNIHLKKSYGETMKVTDVIIEDKALSFLPERFKGNKANFENFVAQSFGSYLSKNQGVSILPFTKGSDIGNKMAIRFSDAKVFQVEIPEPQFAFTITVLGFKKVLTDEEAAGSGWVYGAFTDIALTQPALGKTYFHNNVKNGVGKIIPALQKNVFNEWPVYQESLMVLFDKLTKSFSEDSQYKEVKEVIEKCK